MLVFENARVGGAISFVVNDDAAHETRWCEGLDIVYVLDGAAKLIVGQQAYVLGAEDFMVVNGFEPYSVLCDTQTDTICMRISRQAMAGLFGEGEERRLFCCSARCEAHKTDYLEQIRRVFAALFRATYKQSPVSTAYLFKEVSTLMDILCQHFTAETEGDGRGARARVTEQFRAVLMYMNQNFREELSVGRVAKEHFLTANSLSRYFQRYMRTTFTDYLTGVRLNSAYAELLHGRQSITEIALENGFTSTNSFIKSFKKRHGITPGRFREVVADMHQAGTKGGEREDTARFYALLRHLDSAPEAEREGLTTETTVAADLGASGLESARGWKT